MSTERSASITCPAPVITTKLKSPRLKATAISVPKRKPKPAGGGSPEARLLLLLVALSGMEQMTSVIPLGTFTKIEANYEEDDEDDAEED